MKRTASDAGLDDVTGEATRNLTSLEVSVLVARFRTSLLTTVRVPVNYGPHLYTNVMANFERRANISLCYSFSHNTFPFSLASSRVNRSSRTASLGTRVTAPPPASSSPIPPTTPIPPTIPSLSSIVANRRRLIEGGRVSIITHVETEEVEEKEEHGLDDPPSSPEWTLRIAGRGMVEGPRRTTRTTPPVRCSIHTPAPSTPTNFRARMISGVTSPPLVAISTRSGVIIRNDTDHTRECKICLDKFGLGFFLFCGRCTKPTCISCVSKLERTGICPFCDFANGLWGVYSLNVEEVEASENDEIAHDSDSD